VVDLAFQESTLGFNGWTVVDFKTDREIEKAETQYRAQVAAYVEAVGGSALGRDLPAADMGPAWSGSRRPIEARRHQQVSKRGGMARVFSPSALSFSEASRRECGESRDVARRSGRSRSSPYLAIWSFTNASRQANAPDSPGLHNFFQPAAQSGAFGSNSHSSKRSPNIPNVAGLSILSLGAGSGGATGFARLARQ
jgi:hypothetical protein